MGSTVVVVLAVIMGKSVESVLMMLHRWLVLQHCWYWCRVSVILMTTTTVSRRIHCHCPPLAPPQHNRKIAISRDIEVTCGRGRAITANGHIVALSRSVRDVAYEVPIITVMQQWVFGSYFPFRWLLTTNKGQIDQNWIVLMHTLVEHTTLWGRENVALASNSIHDALFPILMDLIDTISLF